MEDKERGSYLPFCIFNFAFLITGGQGRNRTADAGLFRAALYQLSYLAWIFPKFAERAEYKEAARTVSTLDGIVNLLSN